MNAPATKPALDETQKRIIVGVLLAIAVASVIAAVAGLWPVPQSDEYMFRWFGYTTWKTRIAVAFGAYGLVVFVVLAIGKLVLRMARGAQPEVR